MYCATAFGLTWQSDQPLQHFQSIAGPCADADVDVRLVSVLAERDGGLPINRGTVYPDGARFTWDDIAVFDLHGGQTIDVFPLAGWTGELPWPFFSTVAALQLAWRGALPLHASAVAMAGKAILLCGESGAGKSTVCSALVAQGAQLLSDDLTVLRAAAGGHQPMILPGRPGVRLLPQIAAALGAANVQPIPGDHRGKVMARWPAALADSPVPVAAIILLQDAPAPTAPVHRLACLRQQRFRPRWLDLLPFAKQRFELLAALANTAPLLTLAPLGPFSQAAVTQRTAELHALVATIA